MKHSNWAGNVQFNSQSSVTIKDPTQIKGLIEQAQKEQTQLRIIGSGHSFTPLIQTPGILANLNGLQGIIDLDPSKNEAWVWGGTKLQRLGAELFKSGLAMENLGDIDIQSIAGAVSTGTHGTGINFGILSTQVLGVEIWDGRGECTEISATKNPELLDAVKVSLGALGILTKLKLKLVPKYVLEMKQTKESLSTILNNLQRDNESERNFEFFWFPHTETALVKRSRISTSPPVHATFSQKLNDVVLENIALGALSGFCRIVPKITPSVSRFCAMAAGENHRNDWSHRVFATERWVKFIEMEYSIPMNHFSEVVDEIQKEIKDGKHEVHFPIECRFVQKDSIWLSPAHERTSAFIAVHMYRGMPYQKYFAAIERIFKKYGGRPHWGKWHSMTSNELAEHYPKWGDFQRVRKEMDPTEIFKTDYMRRIFG